MTYTLTYDITVTHQVEVEANSIYEALDLMQNMPHSDVIQDFAENVSTADLSGSSVDNVCILGTNGSEMYF